MESRKRAGQPWRNGERTPFLTGRGLPFANALFVGNIVSVVLLSHLVPWMPNGSPGGCSPQVRIRVDRDRAAALVIALYAVMLLAFRRLF